MINGQTVLCGCCVRLVMVFGFLLYIQVFVLLNSMHEQQHDILSQVSRVMQDKDFNAQQFDPSFRLTKMNPALRPAVVCMKQLHQRYNTNASAILISGIGHTTGPNTPAGPLVGVYHHRGLLAHMREDDQPVNGIGIHETVTPSSIAKVLQNCTTFVFDDLTAEWFSTLVRLICANPKMAEIMDKNQHLPLGDLTDNAAIHSSHLKGYSTVEIAERLVSCNQVVSFKTAKNVTIVSATGVAFHDRDTNAASQRNFAMYFSLNDGGNVVWKNTMAKQELLGRITKMYANLFAVMHSQGVRVPVIIPIGCGAFWPSGLSKELANELAELYFTAKINKALEGVSSGWFDAVLLNPTRFGDIAKAVLKSCKVSDSVKAALILHNKESLSLVEALQDRFHELRMGVVNPSDPLCLVTRCLGYWWEHGIDELYVGEEFLASFTSLCLHLSMCMELKGAETIEHMSPPKQP